MKINYKLLVFILILSLIHCIATIALDFIHFCLDIDFLKTFMLSFLLFSSGYLYAKKFHEQATLLKSLFIIGLVRLSTIAFFLQENISYQNINMAFLFYYIICSCIFIYFFRLGNYFCCTKILLSSNPWIFGFQIVIIYLLMGLPLISIINSTTGNFFYISIVVKLISLSLLPAVSIWYTKTFNKTISLADAIKACTVFFIFMRLIYIMNKNYLNPHYTSLDIAYALGHAMGETFSFLLCLLPFILICAFILQKSGVVSKKAN